MLQLEGVVKISFEIENYLLKISNESVYSAIEKDESLFKLTQIPLFLSILVIVVENISWSKWQTFTKTKERLKYLFDNYIERMLTRTIPREIFNEIKLIIPIGITVFILIGA